MLLDANVLLPPRLSDVLFDFHSEGLFLPRWTGKIEEEFLDHWADVVKKTPKNEWAVGKKKDDASIIADKAKAINRLRCFRAAVGMEYEVVGYEDDEILARVPDNVDEGDIHLVAAALVLLDSCSENGSNDRIIVVSRNIRHLAVNNVRSLGIDVMAPGCFIDNLLSAAKERVGKSLDKDGFGSDESALHQRATSYGVATSRGDKNRPTILEGMGSAFAAGCRAATLTVGVPIEIP